MHKIFFNLTPPPPSYFILHSRAYITPSLKVTVPIPCEGYYCRALCGLSLALAPLWLGVYAIKMFNTNLFLFGSFSSDDNEVSSSGFQCIEPIFALTVVLGALFVRFAPSADGPSVDPKVSVSRTLVFHLVGINV